MIHLIHIDPPLPPRFPKLLSGKEHMEWEVVIHMDQMDQVDQLDQCVERYNDL